MILRDSHHESSPASTAPDTDGRGEPAHERNPLVPQLRAWLGDDDRPESIALRLEPHRLGGSQIRAVVPGGVNSKVTGPFSAVTADGTEEAARRVRPESCPGNRDAPT